jgi:hypothetical protein
MVLFFLFLALASSSLPVVLWHGLMFCFVMFCFVLCFFFFFSFFFFSIFLSGMGDDCCNPSSMGAIKSWIENLTSSYVLSLRIGDNSIEDTINGFLKPAGEQVSEACSIVSQDPKLVNGFNAVGFSQGSQFLRSLVQTCNVTVNNLITLGAQHQGVFGLPDCLAKDSFACREGLS